jgi:tetratricopeptide (TPR) repeat protein
MSYPTPARLAVLCAGCLAISGCGQTCAPTGARTAPVSLGAKATPGPRRLELPADIRPIPLDIQRSTRILEPHLAPAQYQQTYAPTASVDPRLIEIASQAEKSASAAIREPYAALSGPPSAPPPPPRRSEFVPITIPQLGAAPQFPPLPQFPSEPAFALAQPNPYVTQPVEPIAARAGAPAATLPPAQAPIAESNGSLGQPPDPPPTQSVSVQPYNPTMQAVAQRALQIADQADAMAKRGMFYSARRELAQALQSIAQSLDTQEGSTRHATSLAAGLAALTEARDFSAPSTRSGEAASVASIAATHRTPRLAGPLPPQLPPVAAQQHYFAFAQSQLTIAAGGIPASAQILYRLGRLEMAMTAHDFDPTALHIPRAIVFHQASLATDGGNWLAANELGVILARCGQLGEAKQLLLHSLNIRPHAAGWQNLAAVHRRLGEGELAELADQERQRLASQTAKTSPDSNEMVRWVAPKAFAASPAADVKWPDASVAAASSVSRQ